MRSCKLCTTLNAWMLGWCNIIFSFTVIRSFSFQETTIHHKHRNCFSCCFVNFVKRRSEQHCNDDTSIDFSQIEDSEVAGSRNISSAFVASTGEQGKSGLHCGTIGWSRMEQTRRLSHTSLLHITESQWPDRMGQSDEGSFLSVQGCWSLKKQFVYSSQQTMLYVMQFSHDESVARSK